MVKPVVIINGGAGNGKDSFVSLCEEMLYGKVLNVSSVDNVKMAADILVGFQLKSKTDKNRKLWYDLKQLAINYCDAPFVYVDNCINQFLGDDSYNIMFIHVREPEEIDKLKSRHWYIKTLFLKNDNAQKNESTEADKNVGNYIYDYTLENDGSFDDLLTKAKQFLTQFSLL